MTASDIKSVSTLLSLVDKSVDERRQQQVKERQAIGIQSQPTEVMDEAGQEVESASGGVLPADDYANSRQPPSFATPGSSAFEKTFDDTRNQLLFTASVDINAFSRQTMKGALKILDDIDNLLAQMASEAAKVAAAAAAGLLVPPSKADVRTIRDETAVVSDEAQKTVADLRAAKARRDAAKRQLQNDPLVPRASDGIQVTNRYLEPTPDDGYAAASVNALSLGTQSQAPGRVSKTLPAATAILHASVLDRVSYIGICMAIASLDRSQGDKARAEALLKKFIAAIDMLKESLGAGFLSTLQANFQELAAKKIDDAVNFLQSKLDSLDTWLNLSPKTLPTFVSLVDEIGDKAADTPLLDDLAAYCDLNLTSFCDGQGLLEVAKSLDAELAIFNNRTDVFGRVNLLTIAPPANDLRPTTPLPDRETNMFPVTVDGGLQLVARLSQADVRRRHTNPTPQIAATVSQDAAVGSQQVVLSPTNTNYAPQGQMVIGAQTLAYGSHVDGLFSLLAPLTTALTTGTPATVDGEQRDTFVDAFTPSPNIGGGPGSLEVAGEGETRETLAYGSSTFDTATGEYTFNLTSAPAHDHGLVVLCRPQPSRRLLFKGPDLRTTATRFKVVGGDEIRQQDSDPLFDFTTDMVFGDYDGGQYFLIVGAEGLGIEIDAAGSTPAVLKLKAPYYDGDVEKMTLSRIPRPAASTTIRIQVEGPAKRDLLVDGLAIGGTVNVSGKAIVDGGEASGRVNGTAEVSGTLTHELVCDQPVVRGDETAMRIEIQGGVSTFMATVVGIGVQRLFCDPDALPGLVAVSGDEVTGTGTQFTSGMRVNDYLYVTGTGRRKIVAIVDDTHLQLDVAGVDGTGLSYYLVAPVGANRRFSLIRQSMETVDFTSITNVDDTIYTLNLTAASAKTHGLQTAEPLASVRIISDSRQAFLDHYEVAGDNVVTRFDGQHVPPGVLTVRAQLENELTAIVTKPLVLNAANVWAQGRELPLDSVTEDDGVYTLTLVDPLPVTLTAGEVIYVETTSLLDQISTTFPDDWAQPIDDFLRQLLDLIDEWEKKICQLLQGRPTDVGFTMLAIAALLETARTLFLLPLRAVLEMMVAGIDANPVIDQALETFKGSGMDAAVTALEIGDLMTISILTPATSTGEGKTRQDIIDYGKDIEWTAEKKTADEMAAALTAQELDKQILAAHRRPYPEIVAEKIERRENAALALEGKAKTFKVGR